MGRYQPDRLATGPDLRHSYRDRLEGPRKGVIEPTRARLREIELLASLPDAELRALDQRCRWQRYSAGQQIVDRSSENRDVFLVVEGSVRAVDFSPSGREVVYAVIGAGGHFGELSAIDGLARSASVIAIEDCLLAALTPTQFESLIRGQPEVAVALLRKLVGMIRTTDERLTEVTTLGAMARICRELLRLARPDERTGAWLIAPLPTQRDLAGRTGTTRETVARTLSLLTRHGSIRRHGRTLRIHDKAALEAAVAGYQSSGADGSS
jgi:CRP-like cAMP-binding protein